MQAGAQPSETRSTCPYCGVGCGVIIESELQNGAREITGVRGDPDHPANFGRLCTKGSTLHRTATPLVRQQLRALFPEVRADRNSPRARAGWDGTLDMLAQRFASTIAEHGPDSVGFYISGQLLTEDYYVFNKLAKGLIGTNNVDTNSRLCMSSAVAGYKQTLGSDAPPACYEDIDHADLLFISGSNTAYAHPILYRRIEDARARNPGLRTIVVDPRRTDTAREADLHLAILPGTDVALYNGLLHLCLWDEKVDTAYVAAHTEGFAELRSLLRDYTPKTVAQTCGIREEDLVTAARWFGEARAALSLYCQGLNQSASGTAKNAALINLHLATGQIGRPGAGPFSLTGQPNAMGGREVGGMANLLSGHRDLANAAHRAEVAALWGVESVPDKPGKTAVDMFAAAQSGEIRILWIVCTNPAQSMPDQALVRAALERAELVIVQEAFASTATVDYADVLLPASTWGEKDGTVTNSERRISRVRAAIAPAGEARADWRIACDFAQRLEKLLRPDARGLFDYPDAESVWNEHRESTRGRDLDITGMSYAMLEANGPQQWPCPAGAATGQARLYENGVFPTASGRARFVPTPYKPVADKVDARYPLALNTGRLRDQWHGMSRTGSVAQLFAHAAEPVVQMSPVDAARRLLGDGDLVRVASRRGSQILPLQLSEDQRAGQVFVAMHWGSEFVGGRNTQGVNGLTSPACDPHSHQPELKHAAVRIERADLAWRMVVFAWIPAAQALGLQMHLRRVLDQVDFGTCVLFGRDDTRPGYTGVLLRMANAGAPDSALLHEIEVRFDLAGGDNVLRYDDPRRGIARRVRVQQDQLAAVMLRGDAAAEIWLRDYLESGASARALGRLLLASSARAPEGYKPRGRVVCNCLNVSENDILATLATLPGNDAERLAALQQTLRCGTQCGSCVPELKSAIRSVVAAQNVPVVA